MQNNFKYLDNLIHSGEKEIVLDSDIVLNDEEELEYLEGIKLDVDDLTICGNGHAVDACGKTKIFECTGKNIQIKNITLKNGCRRNGGAISNFGGGLTITSSTLTGNTAKKYGGAIYNSGKLTIGESAFTENTVNMNGGAIYNREGELTITESALTENIAEWEGGAIYNYKEKSFNIKNCKLENNKPNDVGDF